MEIQVTGTLQELSEPTTKVSGTKEYFRAFATLTNADETIRVEFTSDKVYAYALKQRGNRITCHCNLSSRESQGKWFNNIRCWKIA